MKRRSIFDKKAAFKKAVRTGALAVLAAVLCVYCSESGVLTASAASRSVTAVRKYNVLDGNSKTTKELKAVPTLKVGKTTVKVKAVGKTTKKYKNHDLTSWNGVVGDAQYKYLSFVKFTAPQTGYYYFTFNNLKMNDKSKMYSIRPSMWKMKKDYDRTIEEELRLCGERNDYTEDYTFTSGYEEYYSVALREILTSNYKDISTDYLNNAFVKWWWKNNPDADEDDFDEAIETEKDNLKLGLRGNPYYVTWQEEYTTYNGKKDTQIVGDNKYRNPIVGKYHTKEKLKKGDTVLIVLSNACVYKWKPTGESAASRPISKVGYTIDLEIKKH